jgi:riboflavin synthase
MFTGLVEATATVSSLEPKGDQARLILTPPFQDELALGDSVAINGCCLTVAELLPEGTAFDLLMQTLKVTSLGGLKAGSVVNLERAMQAGARFGGHFVQGHVDTTTKVRTVARHGADIRMDFEMPAEFACYLAYKGSVAINGVSLTVAEVGVDIFTVWIIPHTAAATNLGALEAGRSVNLECDMLAKYTARILECRGLIPSLAA